ncbi:hypothetical protein D1872_144180 [compost metagenome]
MKKFMPTVRSFWESLILNLFPKAYADENGEETKDDILDEPEIKDNPEGGEKSKSQKEEPSVNVNELISKARKEERDKLHRDITKLKDKLASLTLQVQEKDEIIEQKEDRIGELEIALERAKESGNKAKSTKESEYKQTIENLEARVRDLESDLESEKKNYEVELYRMAALQEAGDEIIPELVKGSTKEEIDASIQSAKERYKSLQEKFTGGITYPRASASASISVDSQADFERLAEMDPRSPEYAELRKKLGL